jgi:transforming growth factor-beta-induced protein
MDGDIDTDEEFEEVSGLSFDVVTGDGDIATLITDEDTTSSTSSSSSASTDDDTSYESIQSERELIFEMLTGMRANGNSETMIRRLQSSSSSSSSSSESSDESSASSSSVSSVDEPVGQNARTIGEIVSSHPNLSIFETALRASNWNVLLEEPGTLTVFAPSNDAFINAGYTVEILLETSNLENLISYHIFSSYSSWFDYEKLQNSPGLFIKAANDQTIAVLVYGNTNDVSLLDINGNRAHIVDPDLMATNGIVHIIDNVLIG